MYKAEFTEYHSVIPSLIPLL